MNSVDGEIIRKCQQGSLEAFELLVKCYQQYAFKIAYGILGNKTDAEDIVQETFTKVYYKIKDLKNTDAFSTWLAKIITNLCYRKSQSEHRNSTVSLELVENKQIISPTGDEAYSFSETKQDIREALLSLPLDYRAVIILRDIQGYAYNEIAEILEIPLGTVKSRINQARALLTDLLKGVR